MGLAALPEVGRLPQIPRIELHDRPNSVSRFSTGPVNATRRAVFNERMAAVCLVGFLMYCASSSTTRCQSIDPNVSLSRTPSVGRDHHVRVLNAVGICLRWDDRDRAARARSSAKPFQLPAQLPMTTYNEQGRCKRAALRQPTSFILQQGDELHRLAEPHVIGLAAPSPNRSRKCSQLSPVI